MTITEASSAARALQPAPRPNVLLIGLGGGVICGGLAALAAVSSEALAAGVFVVQLILVLAFLALVDAPGSGGGFVVAAGAAAVADAVVLTSNGRVSGLAGVIAVALSVGLLHQLLRRGRTRVTESLADTLVAVVLAVSAASLIALRMAGGGRDAVVVCLAAGAGALLAGRLGDQILPRPALAVGANRGWPGLVFALGVGSMAAVAAAGDTGPVAGTRGALLGLAIAATVSAGDLAVDLGAAELTAGRRDARRVSALMPAGLVLPFAALAPVAYVAGRLVLA
ncbi:MAG: hypothetical protein JJD92_06915 [Frankiaceae bacterium]|nr:hypothetical protein [Frankiaceae bacterium]